MSRTVRVLREAEVRAAIDMAGCIEACERAFIAYASGGAELPGVIHLDVPESGGEIHVKAGHVHGAPSYAVKVASGFVVGGGVRVDGLVMAFDAKDGAPLALLLDHGFLTDLRTGAAGGVAAAHLAPARVDTVAVIGTGEQAARQLEALAVVRPGPWAVRIWGRNAEHAAARAREQRGALGRRVDAAASVEAAVAGAQVVLTCTAAREPLVMREWLAPGAHITAVGSDGPGKQELDPAILLDADRLVVDSRDQCLRLGELQHAPARAADTVELGAICAGAAAGRTDASQTTVCDLTGLGVQDVAAANAVLAAAGGGGTTVSR